MPDDSAAPPVAAEYATTIALPSVPSVGPPVVPAAAPVTARGFEDRYARRQALGEGGMGVVHLCEDKVIGREVAMKLMRVELAERPDARERFVREARIQGQLEHPAIVPVHSLGVAPDGAVYFTMKRIRGEPLDAVLAALGRRDARAERRYPRHRLLAAFGQVCLAMDFAHERGVVHRDLKPANIMLGDFGEVYVLDWGIAKVGSSVAAAPGAHAEPAAPQVVAPSPGTALGAVVGTPGYIAPELIALGAREADRRADVYALGAILYEILTYRPMLLGTSAAELLRAAVTAEVPPPSACAADIGPELDALWRRATDLDPALRYERARALHDELDAYLAGRRDAELRREAALRHAATAAEAAERAFADPGGGEAERERAIREVGRALALDPDNRHAMHTLVAVLTTAPRGLPSEAREALARDELRRLRLMSRVGIVAYSSIGVFAPLAVLMGVRSWVALVTPGALGFAAAGFCWGALRTKAARMWRKHAIMVLGCASIGAIALLYGPYLMVPGLLASHTMALLLAARGRERHAYLGLGCLAFLVPVVLQWTGVLPAYLIRREGITILPNMTYFEPLPASVALFVGAVASLVIPMLLVGRLRRSLDEADERGALQTWHLRKLVPDDAEADLPLSRTS
ncbi:MAG: serine/threonine protein kinase [Myxococcales bacterium]|nr:serine/threonine protein kinase [Myxococcales bacterium]